MQAIALDSVQTSSDARTAEQVAFVMENINRIIIPMFERMVDLYEDEVFAFGQLLQGLVVFNTSINALVILIISFFVMRNLWRTAQIMDANFTNIIFSMSIPRNVASKLYNYYDQLETDMRIMEDDEKQAQAAILNAADPPAKRDEGPEFELEMGEMMALGGSAARRSGADDKSPHRVHRTLGSPLPNGGAKGSLEVRCPRSRSQRRARAAQRAPFQLPGARGLPPALMRRCVIGRSSRRRPRGVGTRCRSRSTTSTPGPRCARRLPPEPRTPYPAVAARQGGWRPRAARRRRLTAGCGARRGLARPSWEEARRGRRRGDG